MLRRMRKAAMKETGALGSTRMRRIVAVAAKRRYWDEDNYGSRARADETQKE